MLRKSIYFGLALGLSLTAFGCSGGDGDETGTPADPSTDTSDQPCDCGQPPEDPNAGGGDGEEDVVLGVSKLFLGDTDRDGNPSQDAWKDYGYNLDNLKTTATAKGVCKPRAGADPRQVHADGTDGIDNAFGKSIIGGLITAILPEPTLEANDAIDGGSFTLMLKLDKLGTGPNYSGIKTALYGGGNLRAEPKWDGTDEWPVLYELLEGGDIDKPKIVFSDSYVADRTWVGKADKLNIAIDISGAALSLDINHAIISMDLHADNKGAKNGIIGGVLHTDDLIDTISRVACKFAGDIDLEQMGVAEVLAGASDIMADGTQDPDKTCDGISIGLGFEAKPLQLGEVTEPADAEGEEC